MIPSETAPLRTPADLRAALRRYNPTPGAWILAVVFTAALGTVYACSFFLHDRPVVWLLTFLVGLLALLGLLLGLVTSSCVCRPRAVDLVVALAGAGMAQYLTREMQMPLLVGGAMAGTLLGIAQLWDGPLDSTAAGAGYTGVVAGMVAATITLHEVWILAAGVIAGAVFVMMGPTVLPGVGARMGTAGFIGASFVYLSADVVGAERPALIPPPSSHLPHWGLVVVAVAGALFTWALVNRGGVPYVLASALPSLLLVSITAATLPTHLAAVLGVAWFGGTFVGGTGLNRLPTAVWIAVAAALFGALMLNFEGPLNGHAGVVGVTASIACLAASGLEWLVHARRVAHLIDRVAGDAAT